MTALKIDANFEIWRFSVGVVLFLYAALMSVLFMFEGSFNDPFDRMGLGLTITTWLMAAVFFRNSKLAQTTTRAVASGVHASKRNKWQFSRNPVKWLDVIMMVSAVVTIGLLLVAMVPASPDWQKTTLFVTFSLLFSWAVLAYGMQFMPDKPWIDRAVTIAGAVIAVMAVCVAGLQTL